MLREEEEEEIVRKREEIINLPNQALTAEGFASIAISISLSGLQATAPT